MEPCRRSRRSVNPLSGRYRDRRRQYGRARQRRTGSSLDTEVDFNLYSAVPSPVDNSIWGVAERFPGYLVRVDRGSNPPESCRAEVFRVPEPGFDPRGVDVDTNGVVWTALAASSHLASFDRREVQRQHRSHD